jgi:hypothetical protein
MSTWRDADDPRCPECDEPIAATATYCMHCSGDLTMDDSADVADSDDLTYSRQGMDQGSGGTRGSPGLGERLGGLLSLNQTRDPSSATVEKRDPDRASADRAASLALRLPVAIVVSIPIPFLALIVVLSVAEPLGSGWVLMVLGVSWFGSIAWLARRPLPSEVVGDALYLVAGILVLGPVVNQTDLFLRRLVFPGSVDASFWDILLGLVAFEMALALPVGFLILLGYGGNAWAAKKLDPDDGKSAQPSSGDTDSGPSESGGGESGQRPTS